MYKLVEAFINPDCYYSEIHQHNPIRWQIVSIEDETLKLLTKPFKCKDFFNEVVFTLKTKKPYSIYGFDVDYYKLQLDKDPEYVNVLVTNVKDFFKTNIENVLNPFVNSEDFPEILCLDVEKEDAKLLRIPLVYFKSTFYISNLTLLIRCCNYKPLSKFDPKEIEYATDSTFLKSALTERKLSKFTNLEYPVWHKTMNTPSTWGDNFSVVWHNCGFINWRM